MPKPRVLITAPFDPGSELHRYVEAAGFEAVFNRWHGGRTEEEMIDILRSMEGTVASMDPFTARVIASLDRLRVISRWGVGFENVDVPAATARGIAVCTSKGVNHKTVAEFNMALLLVCARKMVQSLSEVPKGRWVRIMGSDLAESTLGIVGLGAIGKEIVKRALAFEMRILVHTRTPDEAFARQYPISYVPLEQLLRESDFVSLNAGLNAQNRHMINAERLALMKPTAYLVNTARGGLIDTEALYQALKEKRIAGAALDVFEQEPLGESPLRGLDNVYLSAHVAASTPKTFNGSGMMAAESMVRVLRGERPRSILNPEVLDGRS